MIIPKIFIGSSTEGLDLAYAIQENLEESNFAEVTVWTQGIFEISKPIITNLLNSLDNFDFAVFAFTPNDITVIRGTEYSTVRDNVIFETGLFAGRLGLDKVFFLKPKNYPDLHLPSDLLGVVIGEYNANRKDNFRACTGPFCNQTRKQISKVFSQNDPDREIEHTNENIQQPGQLELLSTAITEQVTVFKALNNELRLIKESISTKYIGLFPDFIPYTLDMLRNANKTIEIVCDFPCYSYFSDHEKYISYTNIINDKASKNVSIHLTCPDAKRRKELAMKQLGGDQVGWPLKEELKSKLNEFISRERIEKSFETLTFEDLNERIEEVNAFVLKNIFRNKCYEVDQELPLFYWIVDENQAVFSIPSFTDFNKEQGFLTSDANLIKALKDTNIKLDKKKNMNSDVNKEQ